MRCTFSCGLASVIRYKLHEWLASGISAASDSLRCESIMKLCGLAIKIRYDAIQLSSGIHAMWLVSGIPAAFSYACELAISISMVLCGW